MSRSYSMAYLTARRCSPPQAVEVASRAGYDCLGLRPCAYAPGGPHQAMIGKMQVVAETLTRMNETGIEVSDLEIVRIEPDFCVKDWNGLFDLGATLGAKSVLVAADDPDEDRLAENFARLCEVIATFGLAAELEFMPWTPVGDAATALRIVHKAGKPANAGILVDCLHVDRSNTSVDDIRGIPRGMIHYAQLCDAKAGTQFTAQEMLHTAREARLVPGEGGIDIVSILGALPPEIPISIEVANRELEQHYSVYEWAMKCLSATRSLVHMVDGDPDGETGVSGLP